MTEAEWFKIVDTIFKNLWKKWEINEVELKVWYRKLKGYSPSIVRQAAEDFYDTKWGAKKPEMFGIHKLCRKIDNKRYSTGGFSPPDDCPATPEEKIAILRKQAAQGSEFAQTLLEQKQLDPVAEELSYEERQNF